MTVSQSFELAFQRHQAGHLADAEALYRQVLAAEPSHGDAMHLLGIVAHQLGRHDVAVERIRQAILLIPNNPVAHCNLGEAYRATGQLDEAMASYRRAIQVKPDFPDAHYMLGNALKERGRFEEAIAAYDCALQLKPDYPEACNNLGNALRERGRLDEAIAFYRRALVLRPGYPEAHNNLGIALHKQGQLDESIASYRHALRAKPDFMEAHNNLGAALGARGRFDEAIAAYRHALQLTPDHPEALNNLGNALKSRCELDEAIATYRHALQIKPGYAPAHSNLIISLHYHPDHDESTIAEEHRRWNRQFNDPLKQLLQPHANDPATAGRLRVGYVSPDFFDHSVARFALPLFECHDREQIEILCYSGVISPDPVTERFRALATGWRNMVGVSDARLAEMIREDAVDILVDLSMHTARNRLPMFSRRPAPVQVTWLAYPGGAGHDGIGYRLTDARMDPPDKEPDWFAEEPMRLPDCWCCYQPRGNFPEINPLPALTAKRLTFGSLNNFAKVNERVLALWARALEAVENSRLVLLCPRGMTRERVHAFFAARGIAADRVEFVGAVPHPEYLGLYHRIDLGLDPFPFNGMTTTCDALWMGVPVLTLPGVRPASRAGLSLLSSAGLEEFVASSEEDFIRVAGKLAGNLPRLADVRATLRARMQSSPLMDAPRFARNVEAAYRMMWERWRPAHG